MAWTTILERAPDGYEWRLTRTGLVRHLVRPGEVEARCGRDTTGGCGGDCATKANPQGRYFAACSWCVGRTRSPWPVSS